MSVHLLKKRKISHTNSDLFILKNPENEKLDSIGNRNLMVTFTNNDLVTFGRVYAVHSFIKL